MEQRINDLEGRVTTAEEWIDKLSDLSVRLADMMLEHRKEHEEHRLAHEEDARERKQMMSALLRMAGRMGWLDENGEITPPPGI